MRELLEDISESSNVLNSREKVAKYIESRYLSRTTPTVEIHIFRSLWKLVFKLDNEACEKNRTINLYALEVLSNRNIALILEAIDGDKDYYSNVAPLGMPLSFLVYYLANNPKIYPILNDDARMKIDHCINTDEVGKTMGWFVKNSLATHGEDIKAWILSDDRPTFTQDHLDALLGLSDSDEWQSMFCDIVTTYYCCSLSFDQADNRFELAIPKYISLFGNESLINLADKIDNNDQCHARGKARTDYVVIKERLDELFGDEFDYENVPSFHKKVVVAE